MQRWKFHHENQEKREESFFFSITGSFSQAICREISYKTDSKKKQAAIIKNPYLTLEQVISKTLSLKKILWEGLSSSKIKYFANILASSVILEEK